MTEHSAAGKGETGKAYKQRRVWVWIRRRGLEVPVPFSKPSSRSCCVPFPIPLFPIPYSVAVVPFLAYFWNHSRRYSCVRRKFEGFELVPCHSSLKRIIAVGTFRTLSAS